MLLLLHITAALASLACSAWAFLAPSKAKLRISYGLVVATMTSGTYLVLSTHAALAPACSAGLVYLGVALGSIISAHHKLAAQNRQI